MPIKVKPNAISLFSGMGGDTQGLIDAGFAVKAYSEKEAVFRDTHQANFQNCALIGDGDILKTTDDELSAYQGSIDLIFAGFPCQGFSNAGKKKVNDPRNTLFKEFIRATRLVKPKYIIGENVKGLLGRKTGDDEMYIDVIQREFEAIGYRIKYRVFKTHYYNVPQKRERLIIIGTRLPDKSLNFPEESPTIPTIESIVKFSTEGSYPVNENYFTDIGVEDHSIIEDMENTDVTGGAHPYLVSKMEPTDERLQYGGKTFETLMSYSKRVSPIHCEILDLHAPCKTVICTYDHQPRLFVAMRNANGDFIRSLTVDELKQIQGFPADFRLCGNLKQKIVQIGNAVPPPLITQVAKTLINN